MILNDPLIARFIKWPAIIFFAIAILIALLFEVVLIQNETAEQDYKKLTNNVNHIIRQVRFFRRQARESALLVNEYDSIKALGFVKPLDRVYWTDSLLTIQRELVIAPFSIQFESLTPLEREDMGFIEYNRDIYAFSRLNVVFGLQFGVDIISVQKLINERISPFFIVEQCDIKVDVDGLNQLKFNPGGGDVLMSCSFIIFEANPRELNQ